MAKRIAVTGAMNFSGDDENYWFYKVSPGFVQKYNQTFPNSVVYALACNSLAEDSMADAFLSKGAGTYFGWSTITYARSGGNAASALFGNLIRDGMSTTEAFDALPEYLRIDLDSQHRSELGIRGSSTLLEVGDVPDVFNLGFETGDFSGWSPYGDARIVPRLGPILPTEGRYMALISTGFGSVYNVHSGIERAIQVPAGVTSISFDYDFVTEEYPEWVGTIYDDEFVIELVTSNGETILVARESVNTSDFVPVFGIDFPGGDDTVGHVGWKTATADVAHLACRGSIRIRITDKGDSIYDSAGLVDNIRFH